MSPPPPQVRLSHRIAVGLLVFLLLLLAGLATARAGEFVPSVGYSRTPESTNNQMIYGVSLRGGGKNRMVSELAVGYRNEDYSGGDMAVRTIPVTFSAWASPFQSLYVGGGGGYYYTTQKYREGLGLSNSSARQFAYHWGGGMRLPMGRTSGIDLQYRNVLLKKQSDALPAGSFDPSYWSMSVGISMRY
jgi:hypothetical protein